MQKELCCCDMRGMLSFFILWLLSKKEMHGSEIANEIAKRKGEKPNAGTIYPALKELEKKKLIISRKEGKLKVYSLTEKGRNGLKNACEYFAKAFGEIFAECCK